MEEDVRTLLKKNLEIAQQNNRMLKKMRRAAFLGSLLRLVIWAVILGLPVYLYFNFISPQIDGVKKTYSDIQGGVESVKGLQNSIPDIINLLP